MNYCFEIAVISSIFAVGGIFFGHFEEKTSKFKRLGKFIFMILLSVALTHFIGREAFYVFIAVAVFFFLFVHLYLLPSKGINGWTAEPKDKYYELRGWKKKS
jgi:hypothetical protein